MATHRTPGSSSGPSTSALISAAIVVVALCGMAVGLALAGWKVESIIGLTVGLAGVAGPLVAMFTSVQSRLDRVEHNTNGGLHENVRNAMVEAAPAVAEAVQSGQSGQTTVDNGKSLAA